MINNEITYIANDASCQAAIEDLNRGMDTLQWLGQYLDLYINITYAPENSPRVADCNYLGNHYRYIHEFAILYMQKHVEFEDPF